MAANSTDKATQSSRYGHFSIEQNLRNNLRGKVKDHAKDENDIADIYANNQKVLSSFERKNTKLGTQWTLTTWKTWQTAKNSEADGQEKKIPSLYEVMALPEKEIDHLLAQFIKEVRQAGGEEYPFHSVTSIVFGIQRYARAYAEMKNISPIIMKGNLISFPKLNKAFKDMRLKSRLGGYGDKQKKKQTNRINQAREEALWVNHIFGLHSAQAMSDTIFFYVTKIFGFVSGQSLRLIRSDQFTFSSDEHGKYVEMDVGFTKEKNNDTIFNRCHGIRVSKTDKLRQYCDPNNPRTFYNLLQQYIQALDSVVQPTETRNLSLFMTPKEGMMFANQPIGSKKLRVKFKQIMQSAMISGNYTNLSLVQSIAQRLWAKGYDIRRRQTFDPHEHVEICKILDPPPGILIKEEVQSPPKAILQLVSIPQGFSGLPQIVPTCAAIANNIPIFLASGTPAKVHIPITPATSQPVTHSLQGSSPTIKVGPRNNYTHTIKLSAMSNEAVTDSIITDTSVDNNRLQTAMSNYNLQKKTQRNRSSSVTSQDSADDEAVCEKDTDPSYPVYHSKINDSTEVDINELLPQIVIKQEPADQDEHENRQGPVCEKDTDPSYPVYHSKINDSTEVDINELLPQIVIKQEPADQDEHENRQGPVCEKDTDPSYPVYHSKINDATEVDINELLPQIVIKQEPADQDEHENRQGPVCEKDTDPTYPVFHSKINDATKVDINEQLPQIVIKQEPADQDEHENRRGPEFWPEQSHDNIIQRNENAIHVHASPEDQSKRTLESDIHKTESEPSNKRCKTVETENSDNNADRELHTAEIAYAFSNDLNRKSVRQEVCVNENDQSLFLFSSTNKMGKTVSDLELNLGDYLPDDCILRPGNITLRRVVTPEGGKLVIQVTYETEI